MMTRVAYVPDMESGIAIAPETLEQHKWVYGNHDNPDLCVGHPNCLGHFGYIEEAGIFFISGGYSVDFGSRTAGLDWWPNEELSEEQLKEVVKLYETVKPRVVVSHECPPVAQMALFPGDSKRLAQNRTLLTMHDLYQIHQPEFWVFGHYHRTKGKQIGKTFFRCVGIQQKVEMKAISWAGGKGLGSE